MMTSPSVALPAPLTAEEFGSLERAVEECARFAGPFHGVVYRLA